MPTDTTQQHLRRQTIARLLRERTVLRQAELVALLEAEGFAATQSSVSRDLSDLGAVKQQGAYRLPARPSQDQAEALGLVAEFVRDIRPAGPHLLVVRTMIGAAQRVAVTLDRTAWPEIVGTLSGDDTIFIATSGASAQRRLNTRLRENFQKAGS